MQSDIFGATALGIRNILCLTGDHQTFGNQVHAKNVHDLDSIQLIDWCGRMRDEHNLLGGEDKIDGAIQPLHRRGGQPLWRPLRIPGDPHWPRKRPPASDFIQTQCIYDMERFKEWMQMIRDLGAP